VGAGGAVTGRMEPMTQHEMDVAGADRDETRRPAVANGGAGLPPPPPSLGELPERLHRLHEHPAPLFTPDARGGMRRWVKRAVNVLLRFVGRSQQVYNRDLVDVVTLLMAEVRALHRWSEELAGGPSARRPLDPLLEELATLGRRVADLQACVSSELVQAGRHRLARVEQLATAVQELGRRVETVAVEQMAVLRETRESLGAYAEWITVLDRKYRTLSLEARELTQHADAWPEPRIVDPAAYAARLAAMGGEVRVNLGCGEKPWPDYVNVDLRALPGVDVLADAHRLPFAEGSLAEIASSHLVEHFREHHLRTRLLPYWMRLLRPGGRLRVICPNWAAMLARLGDGRMSLADFKFVTFGAQDYEGDDHFAMYTPETLRALLLDAGFATVEQGVSERMNGLCPEMELVAQR
jgi:methyltransferase family protein